MGRIAAMKPKLILIIVLMLISIVFMLPTSVWLTINDRYEQSSKLDSNYKSEFALYMAKSSALYKSDYDYFSGFHIVEYLQSKLFKFPEDEAYSEMMAELFPMADQAIRNKVFLLGVEYALVENNENVLDIMFDLSKYTDVHKDNLLSMSISRSIIGKAPKKGDNLARSVNFAGKQGYSSLLEKFRFHQESLLSKD